MEQPKAPTAAVNGCSRGLKAAYRPLNLSILKIQKEKWPCPCNLSALNILKLKSCFTAIKNQSNLHYLCIR